MHSQSMTLGELLDLELLLAGDTVREPAERRVLVEAAASAVRRTDPNGAYQRPPLLRAWLDEQRVSGAKTAGQKLDLTFAGTGIALGGLGLFAGGSTALALLVYDGTHPVNVVNFLAFFVGAQLLTLLLLATQALTFSVRRRHSGRAPYSYLHRALRSFLHGRLRAAPAFGRMFAPCETWRLLALTQLFGAAFNVAALAATIGTVLVTDVAFSWSTTLAIDASTMHRFLSLLAAPWAWVLPEAVPSLALVEASQYFRLKTAGVGKFVLPGAAQLYGGWWQFLAASIAFYGLLPRLVLLLLAHRSELTARRRVVAESFELERLADRIRTEVTRSTPLLSTDTRHSDTGHQDSHHSVVAGKSSRLASGAACGVILWRDLPFSEAATVQFVLAATGSTPAFVSHAGGTARDLDGAQAGRAFAAMSDPHVVIIVDVFVALDKALSRFLVGLRAGLGPRARILILPVACVGQMPAAPRAGMDDEKLGLWRRAVRSLDDRGVALAEVP